MPIRPRLARSILLLACACALRADGQGDLRNALARCKAAEPLKAAMEYQFWESSGPEKKPKILQGRLQAVVEDGPQGLRFSWPVPVLNAARQEARTQTQNPDAPDPVRSAMRQLDILQVQTCLDAAEDLTRDLDQARFLEERVETWQDKPARALSFRLEPRLPEDLRKAIKKLDATMKIWIGPDGMPLASSTTVFFKASKLLIGIESRQKEERTYSGKAGRLVMVNRVEEESTTAMGDRSRTRKVLSFSWN